MSADALRVVQISDTHLSAADPVGADWTALARWLRADPPDLVVHTGDCVLVDPDDDADRAHAHRLVTALADEVLVIPGNHDVGSDDEPDERPGRIARFRAQWGDDTFAVDRGAWRLVGADAYRLGEPDHDRWLAGAVAADRPVALFVHQPPEGDPADGWEMPAGSSRALRSAVEGADVRVLACGHRHVGVVADTRPWRTIWCPSTRYVGSGVTTLPAATVVTGTGVVEHRFEADGGHRCRLVRPWEDAS